MKPTETHLALILLISLPLSLSQTIDPILICQNVKCRPGRECRVLSSGEAACVCRANCPAHQKPICGSDGMVYQNHCLMHREACIQGVHIHRRKHDHSCQSDPMIQLKSLIQKASNEVKAYEESHIVVPIACHQNERNRMREFLISWMTLTAQKQPWYTEDMGYHQIVFHHTNASDRDGNGFVDSLEWLKYIERNKTYKTHTLKRQIQQQKLLCLDALVEEGDRNQDWRLSPSEMVQVMSHHYEPSNKYCRMDHKQFEDGTKTKVDCNGCVCSCGKWICTSRLCSPNDASTQAETSTRSVIESSPDEEIFTYEDMDNLIQ